MSDVLMHQNLPVKLYRAQQILRSCFGEHGVWADPSRYRHQCWTRDFAMAIAPLLKQYGEVSLIEKHLRDLSRRQRENGQIPILFLDHTAPFLFDKVKRSVQSGEVSFMLGRYLRGQLWNLTPGTRDSEIMYLMALLEYARVNANDFDSDFLRDYYIRIKSALRYIDRHLMRDGLIIGCDWRDTMESELGDQALLTNNSILYHVLDLLSLAYKSDEYRQRAEKLKTKINQHFWNGESYIDYLSSDRFDPLGGALAVIFDVAPRERYDSLFESFISVDTPLGVTIKCRHNPVNDEEAEVIDRTDGVVVWPFVVGFMIMALLRMGRGCVAEDQLVKLLNHDGFREWYDPATGKGYGAQEQLWSATLFLRSVMATLQFNPPED